MSTPVSQALDLDALPPAAREAFLVLQAEVAGLRAQTERQDYLIAELRHALYGKRSEQLNPDDRQLAFEDLETAVAECEAAGDAVAARNADGSTKRPPAKRNLGHLPDHLPRVEQVIEPEHKVCPCGCTEMVKIPFHGLQANHCRAPGEDRSERLDIIPARFQVIVTIRPRYACRRCDGGVLQAAVPARLIEGGLPTEGTLAHVVVSKYADHLPLYRQSQIYARGGVDLDRSTLATWCGKVGFHLAPIVDRMLVHLKRSTKLFMDETRAPVLDPGAGKTKTGYLWALTRDDRGWNGGDPPAVVFTYAPGRSGSHAMDILRGFDGILQVDGYAGYNALAELRRVGGAPLTLAYCWAHSRRKLHDIYQKDGSEIAAEGLRRIAQIYKIEASVRGRAPEERLAIRQQKSAPIVADFRLWLTLQRARISAKSRLGEKLGYIHRHWDGLQVFLTDGRVEMDTNPVENTIRPITLNRKNALFAGHDEGGRTWARMASLIETCKLNSSDPYAYLRATLEAITKGHPKSQIDDLMPWAFDKTSTR
jgi:transposase